MNTYNELFDVITVLREPLLRLNNIEINSQRHAIDLSIAKWRLLLSFVEDGVLIDNGDSGSCGLCRFNDTVCEDCPIFKFDNRYDGCENTPYNSYEEAYDKKDFYAMYKACRQEIAFLKEVKSFWIIAHER